MAVGKDAFSNRRSLFNIIRGFGIAIGTAILVGCAGVKGVEPKTGTCPEPAEAGQDYRISTGDALQVSVWQNPELSVNVTVRPDGRMSTPLVEDMAAAGKTPSQLASDMEEVLARFLRTPQVSIIVNAQGPGNQIQVVGEVINPQAVPYRDGLRLLDVLVAAGGLAEFAAGNRAILSRNADGLQYECSVRATSLMDGDFRENIYVYPGDVVIVPESRF